MAISDTGVRQGAAYHRNLSVMATVTGLAALAAALHVFTPLNHDEAFLIEGAGRLLDGGRFGVDIYDDAAGLLADCTQDPIGGAKRAIDRPHVRAT